MQPRSAARSCASRISSSRLCAGGGERSATCCSFGCGGRAGALRMAVISAPGIMPRRQSEASDSRLVARIARAFADEQARVVFLTLVLLGVRRSELQALRWADVDLLDGV